MLELSQKVLQMYVYAKKQMNKSDFKQSRGR